MRKEEKEKEKKEKKNEKKKKNEFLRFGINGPLELQKCQGYDL